MTTDTLAPHERRTAGGTEDHDARYARRAGSAAVVRALVAR